MNVFEIPARNTRAANIHRFKTQMYQNSKYKNSAHYKGAKLWDTLPREIKDSTTLGDLKRHLKVLYARYDTLYLN